MLSALLLVAVFATPYAVAIMSLMVSLPEPDPLRVLLVEDSTMLAQRLSEAITDLPDVELVGVVASESAALRAAKDHDIDVMVLDLQLTQGTGFGVMRGLAPVPPALTIIVLTNYDLPEYKSAALSLGARHFLDKSRDYERLSELLGELGAAHTHPQYTPSNEDYR